MIAETLRLARRVMMAIGRGRIQLVDDTDVVQRLQVDRGPGATSVRDKTPMLGLFGLTANPPVGTDVIVLSVGGDWNNAVAIAANHQAYRPKNLEPGDVCLYDIRSGQTIVLNAMGIKLTDAFGNSIAMTEAAMTLTHSTQITLNAPAVALAGTGGAEVARKGDAVSGGVITGGSAKVSST